MPSKGKKSAAKPVDQQPLSRKKSLDTGRVDDLKSIPVARKGSVQKAATRPPLTTKSFSGVPATPTIAVAAAIDDPKSEPKKKQASASSDAAKRAAAAKASAKKEAAARTGRATSVAVGGPAVARKSSVAPTTPQSRARTQSPQRTLDQSGSGRSKRVHTMSLAAIESLALGFFQQDLKAAKEEKKAAVAAIRESALEVKKAAATTPDASSRKRAASPSVSASASCAASGSKKVNFAPDEKSSPIVVKPAKIAKKKMKEQQVEKKAEEKGEEEEEGGSKKKKPKKSAGAKGDDGEEGGSKKKKQQQPKKKADERGEDEEAVESSKKKKQPKKKDATAESAEIIVVGDCTHFIDDCPKCRTPLLANVGSKMIELNRSLKSKNNTCIASREADGTMKDLGAVFAARIKAKFELAADPDASYYVAGSRPPALKNDFLTPDIVMDAATYFSYSKNLPSHCKLMMCAFPPLAKDLYYHVRRTYENQLAAAAAELPGPSSAEPAAASPRRKRRLQCRCDHYNLNRCNNAEEVCCSEEMKKLEDRAGAQYE